MTLRAPFVFTFQFCLEIPENFKVQQGEFCTLRIAPSSDPYSTTSYQFDPYSITSYGKPELNFFAKPIQYNKGAEA